MPSLKSGKFLCMLATVALLPVAAFSESRRGPEPTLKMLTAEADAVVVGTCVSKKVNVVGGRMFETTYEVQVGESLKGKRKPGTTFALTVPGGELTTPPIAMSVQGQTQMTEGEEVVLFLNEKPDNLPPEVSRRRSPDSKIGVGPRVVGMDRGKFTVFKDDATGERKVARVSMENLGFAHQDGVYRRVLRGVATGEFRSVEGQVVPLGEGVYTNPEGKDLLERLRKPEKPRPLARSVEQVKDAATEGGGVTAQNFDEFKAQILQLAN